MAKIRPIQMIYGLIRRRQGNSTGDNAWDGTGTNNTDTSGKDVFMQVGSILSTSGDFSVTFPVAFNQTPIILCQVSSASGFNGTVRAVSVSTTGWTGRFMDTTWTIRSGETIHWLAIGQ